MEAEVASRSSGLCAFTVGTQLSKEAEYFDSPICWPSSWLVKADAICSCIILYNCVEMGQYDRLNLKFLMSQ